MPELVDAQEPAPAVVAVEVAIEEDRAAGHPSVGLFLPRAVSNNLSERERSDAGVSADDDLSAARDRHEVAPRRALAVTRGEARRGAAGQQRQASRHWRQDLIHLVARQLSPHGL